MLEYRLTPIARLRSNTCGSPAACDLARREKLQLNRSTCALSVSGNRKASPYLGVLNSETAISERLAAGIAVAAKARRIMPENQGFLAEPLLMVFARGGGQVLFCGAC
jgi:hypothetical protein